MTAPALSHIPITDETPAAEVPEVGTVVIVDDHRLLAETLAELLRQSGIRARSVIADDRDELLDAVLVEGPDAVLVDYHLGAIGKALTVIEALVARGVAVVVLTGDGAPTTTAECLEAGAAGVLSKGAAIGEVLDALGKAASGEGLVDADLRHELVADLRHQRARRRRELRGFSELTPREADVLRHICDGLSAAEIAEASFVSIATVRSQIRSILMKLGVGSQLAAAAEAYRSGWVERPMGDSSVLAMKTRR